MIFHSDFISLSSPPKSLLVEIELQRQAGYRVLCIRELLNILLGCPLELARNALQPNSVHRLGGLNMSRGVLHVTVHNSSFPDSDFRFTSKRTAK